MSEDHASNLSNQIFTAFATGGYQFAAKSGHVRAKCVCAIDEFGQPLCSGLYTFGPAVGLPMST